MKVSLHRPRLLPVTITAMSIVLIWHSTNMVMAATSSHESPPNAAQGSLGASSGGTSGSSQIASQTDTQAAQAVADTASPLPSPAAAPGESGKSAAAVDDQGLPLSAGERQLLQDLRNRRDEIDARAKALDAREAILTAAQGRMDARVRELAALQTKLEALEAERQKHDQENWASLVKVYEQMKPKDAAQIFDALDMQILLGVLDRMQTRKEAAVLAAMNPERARLATQMLAAMHNKMVTPAGAQQSGLGLGGTGLGGIGMNNNEAPGTALSGKNTGS